MAFVNLTSPQLIAQDANADMSEAKWVDISKRKRKERDDKIPPEWRIEVPDEDDLTDLPRRTSLLSEKELEITEAYDSVGLLQEIRSGRFTSVEVAQAFCKVDCLLNSLHETEY